MKFRCAFICLGILLMATACERSFDSPPPVPPQVVIDDVIPKMAYAGQVVTLIGQEFDLEAGKNEVYFGTELAEVIGTIWHDQELPGDHLAVVVPLLAGPGSVDLRLATDASSDTLANGFHYIGSGHPRDEKLDTLLDTRYAPVALATLPHVLYPFYGILGGDAWLLSWVFAGSQRRLDMGTCDRPVAAAIAATDWNTRPGPEEVHKHPNLQTFVTTVELPDGNQSQALFRLMRWRLNLAQDPAVIHTPDFIFENDDYSPGRVFSLPRLGSDPVLHDLLIANSEAPVARLLRPLPDPDLETEHYALVNFEADDNLPPRILQDAVYAIHTFDAIPQLRVFATISNESGIQIFEPLTPTGQGLPVIEAVQSAIEVPFLNDSISPQFGLLAWCPINQKLYAQVMGTKFVFEFDFQNEALVFTGRTITSSDAPFSITCAADSTSSEKIYLATSNGIEVFSPASAAAPPPTELEQVANLPIPGSRGGPQSLLRLDVGNHDKLVFADAMSDRILSFDAGNEIDSIQESPIGSIFPVLATSTDEARIYYGDTFSNVIRVLDRFSGVLQKQFAIDGTLGFGINQLTTLEGPTSDKLFAPLAANDEVISARSRYGSLAVWSSEADNEALQNSDMCRAGLRDDGNRPNEVLVDTFNEMRLCRNENGARMFFSRDKLGQISGRLWYQDLDLQQENEQRVFGPEQDLSVSIDPENDLMAIDHRGHVVAILEANPNQDDGPDFPKRIRFVDIDQANPNLNIKVDRLLSEAVGHMATLRVEPMPWVEESTPLYVALLSVPSLGQVRLLSTQGDGHASHQVVQTGGVPFSIFISPDERRAYVTHLTEGKVSVIELGCDQDLECVTVTQTIAVEQWPHEVKFNNAGDTAYLTHLFSSRVSIIE